MKRIFSILALTLVASVCLAAPATVIVSCTARVVPNAQMLVTPTSIAFGDIFADSVRIAPLIVKNTGGGILRGVIRPTATCSPNFSLLIGEVPVDSVSFALTANQSTANVYVRVIGEGTGDVSCPFEVRPR